MKLRFDRNREKMLHHVTITFTEQELLEIPATLAEKFEIRESKSVGDCIRHLAQLADAVDRFNRPSTHDGRELMQ